MNTQMVNNLPAMGETQVWSRGQEDPLEKGMVTHSIILVWTIPWIEEPGGLQSARSQRVGYNWATNTTFKHFQILKQNSLKSFFEERNKLML